MPAAFPEQGRAFPREQPERARTFAGPDRHRSIRAKRDARRTRCLPRRTNHTTADAARSGLSGSCRLAQSAAPARWTAQRRPALLAARRRAPTHRIPRSAAAPPPSDETALGNPAVVDRLTAEPVLQASVPGERFDDDRSRTATRDCRLAPARPATSQRSRHPRPGLAHVTHPSRRQGGKREHRPDGRPRHHRTNGTSSAPVSTRQVPRGSTSAPCTRRAEPTRRGSAGMS